MKKENLLINKFPNLVKEWNLELNKDININTILFSSHKKVYWNCEKNHTYLASLNNRTKSNVGSKCPECRYDLVRVHDKETLNNLRENYKPKLNTTSIGDETEDFITNLLLNTNNYENIETIGNIGGNSDIIITHLNHEINYIQIKSLTKNNFCKDTYFLTNDHVYPDNMLIIMLNKEKTRFALEFAGNIKVKRLSLVYNYEKSKYKNIMFKNENDFTKKMLELIPQSCNFNTTYSSIEKEKLSLSRLNQFCINNNLIYKRNKTNGNTIDCFINNLAIQTKFVSINCDKQLTYNISSTKSCGKLNKKNIKRNYEENDFDMIVIEIGGTIDNSDKYINNFCFIPKNILIEQNILKTKKLNGKKSFYICPPDYEKNHWSKKFWNKILHIPKY